MRVSTILGAVGLLALTAGQACAISDQECDRKFEAARTTQSLNGMDREAFGRTQCADPSNPAPQPGSAAAPAAPASDTSPTTPAASRPKVVTPSKP